jgi:ABC-type multidrug transport system fused ATPase/permease subunit
VVDPLLALVVFLVLGSAYGIVYAIVRRRLAVTGRKSIEAATQRYRLASDALHGIKEIKLLGIERQFCERYSGPSQQAARYEALGQAIANLPRYVLETVAFGGILLIVLYLLASKGGVGEALPLIALYALAGYRLMPALQQIFSALTQIRFNRFALDKLYDDMRSSAVGGEQPANPQDTRAVPLGDRIELRGAGFSYPGADRSVISNLNLAIRANTTVGLAGQTGAGKTTIVDIILGLLPLTHGELIVDGVGIGYANVRQWRRNLGYVPQAIYLSDDTVASNIAFGLPPDQIDLVAVERAARAADIHDFVAGSLPSGYYTLVGERGVRLSGGQRQRIAIARALYRDPPVLVLDEATSALDGITEGVVMEAIQRFSGRKTIIVIAHRVTTLRTCDVIYLFDRGRVTAAGSYQDLLASNVHFRAMANAQ